MDPKGLPKEWLAWFLPAKRAFCFLSLFFRPTQHTRPHRPPIPKTPSLMLPSLASSFHGLPAEIILDICDFLAPDALLALKLTAPRLNAIIRLDPRRCQAPLSSCARRAIRTLLESPSSKPDQKYCFLCNATYPSYKFSSSTSPACISAKTTTSRDIIQLPPNVCAWHVGRLARTISTGPGGRNEWVTNTNKMCMHCGYITAWSQCNCKCDSCSFWTVQTYTRYLNNTNECHKFLFWRAASPSTDNGVGQLWVRESGLYVNTIGHLSHVDFPIASA